MSNNKQTMKLYTEEQLRNSMLSMKTYIHKYNESVIDSIIEKHIKALGEFELPSDEEIENMGKDVIVYNDTKRGWFVEGLRFMRDKIQGGNK
jgi:hypothetical protein